MSYFSPRVPKSEVITSKRETQQSWGELHSADSTSPASLRHRADPERNPNSGCLEKALRKRPPATLKVERLMGWDMLCPVPHRDQGWAWERGTLELWAQEAAAGSRSSSMPTTIQPPPVSSAVLTYGVKLGTAMKKPETEAEFYRQNQH